METLTRMFTGRRIDWERSGRQQIDVDPQQRHQAIATLKREAMARNAELLVLPSPWAHTLIVSVI